MMGVDTVAPRLRTTAQKAFWRLIYEAANRRLDDPGTAFMNYGYAPLGAEADALPLAPELECDRFGLQLYRRVAGATDLDGKDVLEVGCGRGGGATFVFDEFRPRSMTAVDLS